MGELDVNGSEYDPHKKVIAKHLVFYLMVIIFMAFMTGGTSVNLKSTAITNSTLSNITDVYNNMMSLYSQLKKVSYYIWEGSSGYQQKFGTSVESTLIPSLDSMSKYYTFTGNETNLISSCDNQTIC
jgi:hypothetical protein